MKTRISPEIIELSLFYDMEEPILKEELVELLKSKGFEEVSEAPEIIDIGGIALERATIAKKRGCRVNYNKKSGIISVTGDKYNEILITYEELENILESKGLFEGVKRFEHHSRVRVQIGSRPVSTLGLLAQAFGNSYLPRDKFSKFEEIMGMELQPFCIRLCPKSSEDFIGDLRKNDNWLDVYIFPYVPNTRYLSIWLVFRNKNSEIVKEFTGNAEERIKKMLEVIIGDGT